MRMSKRRFMEATWRRDPWFRALVAAFASCKTEEELTEFLRDIGTLSELQAWSERLEVAKLLSQGATQREVSAKTGASTTTVNRVARYLENGQGYTFVLERLRTRENPEGVIQEKKEDLLRKYLQPRSGDS